MVRGELLLAVGGATALKFDAERVTADVYGFVLSEPGAVIAAANDVRADLVLRRGWLNEGVSACLSTQPDPGRHCVVDHPALAVTAVSPEHGGAARPNDLVDIAIVADRRGVAAASEVFATLDRFFPADAISERVRAAVADTFGRGHLD